MSKSLSDPSPPSSLMLWCEDVMFGPLAAILQHLGERSENHGNANPTPWYSDFTELLNLEPPPSCVYVR